MREFALARVGRIGFTPKSVSNPVLMEPLDKPCMQEMDSCPGYVRLLVAEQRLDAELAGFIAFLSALDKDEP